MLVFAGVLKGRADVHFTDEDISLALQYWYRKGSREVGKFNKRQFIEKAAVEKNGICSVRAESWTDRGSSPHRRVQ